MTPEEIGSFLVITTIAILFLMGAWAFLKNEAARKFATTETGFLFK